MLFAAKTGKQGHIIGQPNLVPAHMRDDAARRYGDDVAGYQAKAFVRAEFAAFVEEHLVADANTEEGFAGQRKVFNDGTERAEGVDGKAEGGDARQDQRGCCFDFPAVAA